VLSACIAATPTFDASTDPAPLVTAVLTPDAAAPGDTFIYQRDGGNLTISADPTNTGGNTRQLYWPSDGPAVEAEQSCETWTGSTGALDQQGIALRIAPTADGQGIRTITVTKNIWFVGYWLFNVHVWDSTASTPWTLLQTFDMSSVVGGDPYNMVPYPWHVCARVSGNIFQFILWTGANPQPSWDDAGAVRQLTLPDGWDYPGQAGWYIGHLESGSVDTFTDMRTWSLKGTFDPPTTSTTSTTSTSTTTTSTVAGP
jgi:hypothetical protein